MKIEHNITRDGRTLSGYITNTIFEEGEKRGDKKCNYSLDRKYVLESAWSPFIGTQRLFVWWNYMNDDSNFVSREFELEQEAQEVLDYINEFTIQPEPKQDEFVQGEVVLAWDWDWSKSKFIYLATLPKWHKYRHIGTFIEDFDKKEDKYTAFQFIKKLPPEPEITQPLSNEEIIKLRALIK